MATIPGTRILDHVRENVLPSNNVALDQVCGQRLKTFDPVGEKDIADIGYL